MAGTEGGPGGAAATTLPESALEGFDADAQAAGGSGAGREMELRIINGAVVESGDFDFMVRGGGDSGAPPCGPAR